MSDNNPTPENVHPENGSENTMSDNNEQVRRVHFMSGDPATVDHDNCHEDSPCKSGEAAAVLDPMGIHGVVVDGETYLSRADLLVVLATVMNAYTHITHLARAEGQEEAAFSTYISAQTLNTLGGQLSGMTAPERALNLDLAVPDTIPADWFTDSAPAAPESPIEAAIRKAKEAALEAQRNRDEGK